MKKKEISRFVYEDKEYIIGLDVYTNDEIKIGIPWFYITINSSKKFRKATNKCDAHHLKVNLKNPFPLYSKIFKAYEENLINFDYILFCPYRDDKEKRVRVYSLSLNKLGFELQEKSHKHHIYLYKRKEAKVLKKKYLSGVFTMMNDYIY